MPNLWVTTDELQDNSDTPFAYEAVKTASFILWALSGRKYSGTHTITEFYECNSCGIERYPARLWNQPGLFPAEPYLVNGAVMNASRLSCGSGKVQRLRLRHRPVRRVQEITQDGVTVDPASYQVVDGAALQAAPGHSFNPCGIRVTYTYGVEPPAAGRRAARYLAQELAKGWAGEDCDLPERVTSVSRQGVSYTILDDQAFLDDMRTGIYSVDLFLKTVNPDRARKPARVFSPDLPRAVRVTSASSSPSPVGPYDISMTPGTPTTWSASLTEIGADILLEPNWVPQGQITTWNGATVLEFDPARFSISDGVVTMNLTGAESGTITGDGTFDLYALNELDGYTVIHLLTSNVRVVS